MIHPCTGMLLLLYSSGLMICSILDFGNFKTQYRHYYTASEYFITIGLPPREFNLNTNAVFVTSSWSLRHTQPSSAMLNQNTRPTSSLPLTLNKTSWIIGLTMPWQWLNRYGILNESETQSSITSYYCETRRMPWYTPRHSIIIFLSVGCSAFCTCSFRVRGTSSALFHLNVVRVHSFWCPGWITSRPLVSP